MKVRKRLFVKGIVQGVGFRPFVYRLASQFALGGYVLNDTRGVEIAIEGELAQVNAFTHELLHNPPPLARITGVEEEYLAPRQEGEFAIRESRARASRSALVSPDMATCDDCLRELFDPEDHRHRYPFINCTNCGPRYTIITDIPYDRPQTTMRKFTMCAACQREYDDPTDRRFHAQPNACWQCGPGLALLDERGKPIIGVDPINFTVKMLKEGKVAALKGLGGFHLAVDATNETAVAQLRKRKLRIGKPFAIMANDLERVREFCEVSADEEAVLRSPERPIVLLRKCELSPLVPSIAPGNGYLGVMLPYTPIHHLILREGNFSALVMTSGNVSEEPIARTNYEAREKLAGIADCFLLHDRDIYLRNDDSVVRASSTGEAVIRRSRGYAPRPVFISNPKSISVLAVGPELKNTICLTRGDNAFLSQHVGDLQGLETYRFFLKTIAQMTKLLEVTPEAIARDEHPDYLSSRYAREQSRLPVIAVQHHHAHVVSVLAERGRTGPVIGVVLDGTGFGEDGAIWGGEFLIADLEGYQRVGHLAYVRQPGGDRAAQEPWRMAVAYLYAAFGDECTEKARWFFDRLPEPQQRLILEMLHTGAASPYTSSMGRLFDGVSALLGLCLTNTFEAEAPMALEAIIDEEEQVSYPVEIRPDDNGMLLAHPGSIVKNVVRNIETGLAPSRISARFHNTIAHLIVQMCVRLRQKTGIESVALSGGVFQNNFLARLVPELLAGANFEVLEHTLVPANDGGVALGQAAVALARLAANKKR